jgi:TRAP-type C4-dicarboxylate transport system permease small subunit
LFLQIIHRVLVWLAYLLLLIVGILLLWYSYTLIISAKDWILEVWDTLYGYVMDVYDTLHQVYEFILEIPSIVVGFLKTLVAK